MSFKALPVKIQQLKNRQWWHNVLPGTERVKTCVIMLCNFDV